MSVNSHGARGGEFATSRKGGIDQYEIAFIRQKAEVGCSDGVIARMLARSEVDVRATREAMNIALGYRKSFAAPRSATPAPKPRREIASAATMTTRPIPERARLIVLQVCSDRGLDWDEIMSTSRKRRIAYPRQEAFHLLFAAGFAYADIGRYFGGMDHTTARHGDLAHIRRHPRVPQAAPSDGTTNTVSVAA